MNPRGRAAEGNSRRHPSDNPREHHLPAMTPTILPLLHSPYARPVYVPRRRNFLRPPDTSTTATATSATSSSSSLPATTTTHTTRDRSLHRGRGRGRGERLHGAFTGGFSAGYFNTVGSAEGWQPRSYSEMTDDKTDDDQHYDRYDGNDEVNQMATTAATRYPPRSKPGDPQRRQRLEDFMDEQDHNEWGGPQTLRDEYHHSSAAPTPPLPSRPAAQQSVGRSYQRDDAASTDLERLWAMDPRPSNIGRRLLRVLGFRSRDDNDTGDGKQSGTAAIYLPTGTADVDQKKSRKDDDDEQDDEQHVLQQQHLSRHRLRKIQVQQQRMPIPAPKLDTVGLGFEPYKDAPEFRQHRARLQQASAARQQQFAAAANHRGTAVYRMSTIAGKNHRVNLQDRDNSREGDGMAYDTAPTVQHPSHHGLEITVDDFVGTKTVGGFALQDDMDDAYDDDNVVLGKIPRLSQEGSQQTNTLSDQYDMVAYEPESDNEETLGTFRDLSKATNDRNHDSASGGFLSSWVNSEGSGLTDILASGPTPSQKTKDAMAARVFSTDGHPVLPGFVLGNIDPVIVSPVHHLGHTSLLSPSIKPFYRGPDVPADYIVQPHRFNPEEHPRVLQVLAHVDELHRAETHRQQALDEGLVINARSYRSTKSNSSAVATCSESTMPLITGKESGEHLPGTPMTGNAFASLAMAMKNRFTSASSTASPAVENLAPSDAIFTGSEPTSTNNRNNDVATTTRASGIDREKVIRIVRTTTTFIPEPLLCKRFQVPVPVRIIIHDGTADKTPSLFGDHVLEQTVAALSTKNQTTSSLNDDSVGKSDRTLVTALPPIPRPSLSDLQSIFEPLSDESSSATTDLDADSSDDDDSFTNRTTTKRDRAEMVTGQNTEHKNSSSALAVHQPLSLDGIKNEEIDALVSLPSRPSRSVDNHPDRREKSKYDRDSSHHRKSKRKQRHDKKGKRPRRHDDDETEKRSISSEGGSDGNTIELGEEVRPSIPSGRHHLQSGVDCEHPNEGENDSVSTSKLTAASDPFQRSRRHCREKKRKKVRKSDKKTQSKKRKRG